MAPQCETPNQHRVPQGFRSHTSCWEPGTQGAASRDVFPTKYAISQETKKHHFAMEDCCPPVRFPHQDENDLLPHGLHNGEESSPFPKGFQLNGDKGRGNAGKTSQPLCFLPGQWELCSGWSTEPLVSHKAWVLWQQCSSERWGNPPKLTLKYSISFLPLHF